MIHIKRFVFERAVDFITLKRTFPDTATNYSIQELFPAF